MFKILDGFSKTFGASQTGWTMLVSLPAEGFHGNALAELVGKKSGCSNLMLLAQGDPDVDNS